MSNITDVSRRTLEDYLSAQDTRNTSGSLGKTEFMSLLVAQLANQDPLEPAKDTEFIAQLAQFSTLEQMQLLTQSYSNTQASSMVGKYIEGYYRVTLPGVDANGNAEYREEKVQIAGLVSGIKMKNGVAELQIQGLKDYTVKLEDVQYIVDAESIDGLSFNSSVLESSALIGKYVKATFPGYAKNEDGTDNEDVVEEKNAAGYVDRISVENSKIYAHIGDTKFDVRYIYDIALGAPATAETDAANVQSSAYGYAADYAAQTDYASALAQAAADLASLPQSGTDYASYASILQSVTSQLSWIIQNLGMYAYNDDMSVG